MWKTLDFGAKIGNISETEQNNDTVSTTSYSISLVSRLLTSYIKFHLGFHVVSRLMTLNDLEFMCIRSKSRKLFEGHYLAHGAPDSQNVQSFTGDIECVTEHDGDIRF